MKNVRLLEGNIQELNRLRLPALGTIYENAFQKTDYNVPRMMYMEKKIKQVRSDERIIQFSDEFEPKEVPETIDIDGNPTKAKEQPVEFRVSALRFDFTLGADECNRLIDSLIRTKNPEILRSKIFQSYVRYMFHKAIQFIYVQFFFYIIFTFMLTLHVVHRNPELQGVGFVSFLFVYN